MFEFQRRDPKATDVEIDILFAGVCHSDLHTVKSEWAGTVYPCVPGHEILGRVTRVGGSVRGFKAGDVAAVGCMVGSCRTCRKCKESLEQYCETHGTVFTYNSPDEHLPGQMTYGGYSTSIVVDEAFCFRVSEKLDPAGAAPLLCAGITTYSPLRHWGAGVGRKVGVVGIGGLGHMGVKFAAAFGAETVAFTTSASKIEDAKRFGAHDVIVSKDTGAMEKHAESFDLILNTVSVSHDLNPFLNLLRPDGALVLVGVPEHPHPSPSAGSLIMKRRSLAGSLIGGTRETQEMLDFCAERKIVCDVEKIPMQQINEAYERLVRADVKYRFVIEMASLKA